MQAGRLLPAHKFEVEHLWRSLSYRGEQEVEPRTIPSWLAHYDAAVTGKGEDDLRCTRRWYTVARREISADPVQGLRTWIPVSCVPGSVWPDEQTTRLALRHRPADLDGVRVHAQTRCFEIEEQEVAPRIMVHAGAPPGTTTQT